MKVLYVLHSTDSFSGASKAFLTMLLGLKERGVQAWVAVPSDGGICHFLRQLKIPVSVIVYKNCTYPSLSTCKDICYFLPRLLGRLFVNRRAVVSLSNLIHSNQIQLVHTNVSILDVGFRAARRVGIPHVYHLREYAAKIGKYHYLTPNAFKSQLHHSALSYAVCITKGIADYYGLSTLPNAKVIYDGVAHENVLNIRLPKQRYFLYVGRLESSKGVDIMIDAYAHYICQVSNPVPLRIVGEATDDAYYHHLQSMTEAYHVGEYVSFLGLLEDVSEMMSEALALIVPSRFEGFGLCMSEAMFHGCLVLAHDAFGLGEQLENGREVTGQEIALGYDTQDNLTNLLCMVHKHGIEPYLPLLHHAHEVVNTLYTSKVNAAQVVAFYQEILNSLQTSND